MDNPEPSRIRAARKAAGHTQAQAGATIYKSANTWHQWEIDVGKPGHRKMDPAYFELYCIKTQERKQ